MSNETLMVLKESEQRIQQLCNMVNSYSNKLGLGNKVRAEDWTDVSSIVVAKLKFASQKAA